MARKNPELNKRLPAYQQIIDKGYDTDEYFFTFTRLKKVGINPTSQHETPNGIYCFPATEILEQVHGNMRNVPYVNNAPYIHVLKKRGSGIIDPLEKYSQSDYTRDMKKIYKIITETKKGKFSMNPEGNRYVSNLIIEAQQRARESTPISWFWNVTKEISADESISTLMGWGGVKSHDYKKWYTEEDEWEQVASGKRERRKRDDRKGFTGRRGGVSYNAQGWNNLLRRLGYNGFVDRSGSGTIHPNEPTQAVFMSSKAFTVVDMIENKSYEHINIKDDISDGIEKLEKKGNVVSINSGMNKDDIELLNNLAETDIQGCEIIYNKKQLFISGGDINNFYSNVYARFNNVRIHGGNFYYIDYITDCVIYDGYFKNCGLTSCDIVRGDFTECRFYNIEVINNSSLERCSNLDGISLFNCNMNKCRIYDCLFSNGCAVNSSFIINKSRNILSTDVIYYKSNIKNVTVLKGYFDDCTIEDVITKGGDFNKGTIDNSVIKDGNFEGVKIRETDIQGGNIK